MRMATCLMSLSEAWLLAEVAVTLSSSRACADVSRPRVRAVADMQSAPGREGPGALCRLRAY